MSTPKPGASDGTSFPLLGTAIPGSRAAFSSGTPGGLDMKHSAHGIAGIA